MNKTPESHLRLGALALVAVVAGRDGAPPGSGAPPTVRALRSDVTVSLVEPGILHAARSMGVPPGRCVVVEDSRFGVEAARAAGMRALAYAGGLTGNSVNEDFPVIYTPTGLCRVVSLG